MITYPYEYLFRQDSSDKQLIITDGEITLTNVDIYQESFELTEVLSATRDLTYGSCNSATLRFTTSKLERFKGRELTVSVVVDGHTEAPFTFGTYKVYEDKYTADRTKKDLVCYDSLYEVINANVIDWYNTILPDMNTTVTLKQFRDSFFNHFGITQETITLDNDTETISKTVDGEVLSGANVLTRICEMNGCFGRINRQGNFEYFYVHATNNPLYPALTLYPDINLFPSFDGQYDANEIGENGTYISAQYEDYDVMPIDKLVIRQEDGDAGVEIGTGTNKYIIQGNFLLFGKSATDLTRIANKIYTHIADGAYYRPCEIELKGNPCIEIGDGIALVTRNNDRIVTFVTHRVYSGIQAQRDVYSAEGTEYRDEDVNSYDTQLRQLRNKSNILTRDLEHTESVITDEILSTTNPTSLQSQITQTAEDITTKVSKDNIISEINQSAEQISINAGKINLNGAVTANNNVTISQDGKITAKSGYIGNGSNGFEIGNTYIRNGMTSLNDTTNNGIYEGTDGIALGKGNFKVTSGGALTAKSGYIGNGSNGFEIGNTYIRNGMQSMSDISHNGIYLGTDGIALGKGNFKVDNSGNMNCATGNIGLFRVEGGELRLYNGTRQYASIYGDTQGYGNSGSINIEGGAVNIEGNYTGVAITSTPNPCTVIGNFQVTGTKSRIVETDNYGLRKLNALETAECYFSDLGSATCNENGEVEITFEEIFKETVELENYKVQITPTSDNFGWVEKKSDKFVIHSSPNATFDWVVYCKQKGYSNIRLERGETNGK